MEVNTFVKSLLEDILEFFDQRGDNADGVILRRGALKKGNED
jgi:hypothetical protein